MVVRIDLGTTWSDTIMNLHRIQWRLPREFPQTRPDTSYVCRFDDCDFATAKMRTEFTANRTSSCAATDNNQTITSSVAAQTTRRQYKRSLLFNSKPDRSRIHNSYNSKHYFYRFFSGFSQIVQQQQILHKIYKQRRIFNVGGPYSEVGLPLSSSLLLEYSIEYIIEYSSLRDWSTHIKPKVKIYLSKWLLCSQCAYSFRNTCYSRRVTSPARKPTGET